MSSLGALFAVLMPKAAPAVPRPLMLAPLVRHAPIGDDRLGVRLTTIERNTERRRAERGRKLRLDTL